MVQKKTKQKQKEKSVKIGNYVLIDISKKLNKFLEPPTRKAMQNVLKHKTTFLQYTRFPEHDEKQKFGVRTGTPCVLLNWQKSTPYLENPLNKIDKETFFNEQASRFANFLNDIHCFRGLSIRCVMQPFSAVELPLSGLNQNYSFLCYFYVNGEDWEKVWDLAYKAGFSVNECGLDRLEPGDTKSELITAVDKLQDKLQSYYYHTTVGMKLDGIRNFINHLNESQLDQLVPNDFLDWEGKMWGEPVGYKNHADMTVKMMIKESKKLTEPITEEQAWNNVMFGYNRTKPNWFKAMYLKAKNLVFNTKAKTLAARNENVQYIKKHRSQIIDPKTLELVTKLVDKVQ